MAYSTKTKNGSTCACFLDQGLPVGRCSGTYATSTYDKMFVIIAGDSVVTKPPETEKQDALKNHGATEFIIEGVQREASLWREA